MFTANENETVKRKVVHKTTTTAGHASK